MARGRPPKPTALKKLAGNPGKRKLNDKEPKPKTKKPPCPAHIRGEARKEWNRMSKQLFELGLLTGVDRAALAAYCVAYGRWVEAETQVSTVGMIIETVNGNLVQNPYLSVANRAMEQMWKISGSFGMTPSSRSRMQVATDADKKTVESVLDDAVGDED